MTQKAQHLAALAAANKVRLARATLLRKLRERKVTFEKVLHDPIMANVSVDRLITSTPTRDRTLKKPARHSKTRATLLGEMPFSPNRRLGELTERQKRIFQARIYTLPAFRESKEAQTFTHSAIIVDES